MVACLVVASAPARAASVASPEQVDAPVAKGVVPAWPCRLVVPHELRPAVTAAWERSATFRQQCERLAEAGALVVLRAATSVQIRRPAQSQIGVSADGVIVAQVLIRVNADSIEAIGHELEHVIEYIEKTDFHRKLAQPRSGVTLSSVGYETDRAIDAGTRVAREARAGAAFAGRAAPEAVARNLAAAEVPQQMPARQGRP